MTAFERLRTAKQFLTGAGVDDARREAESIIAHCLGIDRVIFYRDNPQIPEHVNSKIDELLRRRARWEPLQYILGYTEFYGLKITVGSGVLVPRPETELLVEETVKVMRKIDTGSPHYPHIGKGWRILDLCTGSGCIALALGTAFPDAIVYGIDFSETAIEYAGKNAGINGVRNVTFIQGNLFEPVRESLINGGPHLKFDLIVSNPPYIKTGDIKDLQQEVREWEPAAALDGGEDGLDCYKIIIPESMNFLRDRGLLILEIGMSQAAEVTMIAREAGFSGISLIRDYAGIERIVIAQC